MKIVIQQRILPKYRLAFFKELSSKSENKIDLLAGTPSNEEGIKFIENTEELFFTKLKNRHFLKGQYYLCWQSGILSYILNNKIDSIVMDLNPRILSNWIILIPLKIKGVKIIGWGLGILPKKNTNKFFSKLRYIFLKFSLKRFNHIISYSQKGKNDYLSLGFKRHQITVAPNSVKTLHIKSLKNNFINNADYKTIIKTIIKKFDIDSSIPIVFYVGRLVPGKNIDRLINVCSKIRSKFNLIIVGDGPDIDNLKKLNCDLKFNAIFTGHLSGIFLAAIFFMGDLFVLPGSGGLAIQEAMAYGNAVITADGDGTQQDLISDGINGYLLPTNYTMEYLKEIIINIIKDKNHLQKLGNEAKKTIEHNFNMDIMIENYLNAVKYK